jgi:hypothetical protein
VKLDGGTPSSGAALFALPSIASCSCDGDSESTRDLPVSNAAATCGGALGSAPARSTIVT